MRKLREFIFSGLKHLNNSRGFAPILLVAAVALLAIPVTTILVQQQQDNRQNAQFKTSSSGVYCATRDDSYVCEGKNLVKYTDGERTVLQNCITGCGISNDASGNACASCLGLPSAPTPTPIIGDNPTLNCIDPDRPNNYCFPRFEGCPAGYNESSLSCSTSGDVCCQKSLSEPTPAGRAPAPTRTGASPIGSAPVEPSVKCNVEGQTCGSGSYPTSGCAGNNWNYSEEGNAWCRWKNNSAPSASYCYTCAPTSSDPAPTAPPPPAGWCATDARTNPQKVGNPTCTINNTQYPNNTSADTYCRETYNDNSLYYYDCGTASTGPQCPGDGIYPPGNPGQTVTASCNGTTLITKTYNAECRLVDGPTPNAGQCQPTATPSPVSSSPGSKLPDYAPHGGACDPARAHLACASSGDTCRPGPGTCSANYFCQQFGYWCPSLGRDVNYLSECAACAPSPTATPTPTPVSSGGAPAPSTSTLPACISTPLDKCNAAPGTAVPDGCPCQSGSRICENRNCYRWPATGNYYCYNPGTC